MNVLVSLTENNETEHGDVTNDAHRDTFIVKESKP